MKNNNLTHIFSASLLLMLCFTANLYAQQTIKYSKIDSLLLQLTEKELLFYKKIISTMDTLSNNINYDVTYTNLHEDNQSTQIRVTINGNKVTIFRQKRFYESETKNFYNDNKNDDLIEVINFIRSTEDNTFCLNRNRIVDTNYLNGIFIIKKNGKLVHCFVCSDCEFPPTIKYFILWIDLLLYD